VFFVLALALLCFAAEEKMVISIEGMSCGGCIGKITSALNKIDGVKSVEVTLEPGAAIVVYESDKANDDVLLKAVADLGYKASCGDKVVGKATHCKSHGKKEIAEHTSDSHNYVQNKDHKEGSHHKGDTHLTKSNGAVHVCPTVKCKEMKEFHEAMHPIHTAIEANDYKAARLGYPELSKKAKIVEHMNRDSKCRGDKEACKVLSTRLVECVKKLGDACKDDDNSQLAEAFEQVHDAYAAFGKVCK